MSGPLEIIGATDAPMCEDGVCAVPAAEPDRPGDTVEHQR